MTLEPKVKEITGKYGHNFLDLPDGIILEAAAVLDLYRNYYAAKGVGNEDPGYYPAKYISLPENAENIIKDLSEILKERHRELH